MISGDIGCVGRVFLKQQNLTSLLQGFYTFFYTAFTSVQKCKIFKDNFYMTNAILDIKLLLLISLVIRHGFSSSTPFCLVILYNIFLNHIFIHEHIVGNFFYEINPIFITRFKAH